MYDKFKYGFIILGILLTFFLSFGISSASTTDSFSYDNTNSGHLNDQNCDGSTISLNKVDPLGYTLSGIYSTGSGTQYQAFWSIDSSALPDDATVEAAWIQYWVDSENFNFDDSIAIRLYNCSFGDLTTADWDTATDTFFGPIAWEGMTVNQYYEINVSTVVNLTGDTQFCATINTSCVDDTIFSRFDDSVLSKPVTLFVTYTGGADTTPPNIDFISPTASNGTLSENQTYIVWNISVNEDVALGKIEINGTNQTCTAVNDTTNSYCYYNETGLTGNVTRCAWGHATDAAGNWNTTLDYICMNTDEQQPDVTAPTVNIAYPENTTYTLADTALNVSASEIISTWYYELNGNGTNITFTPNVTLLGAEGQNFVTVWANDTANNWGTAIQYFTIDTTPPDIIIDAPLNQTYSAIIDLNVTVNDVTSSVDSCLYNLNGGANTSLLNDSETNWFIEVTPGSDGLHQLIIYCNDSEGNMGLNNTIWFTYDTTSPSIIISSPTNTTYAATFNLNVTSTDVTSTVDNCLYNLNGGVNTSLLNDSETNWFITVTPGTDGLKQLNVYCNDSEGNMNLNDTIWFTYDTTPPILDFSSPTPSNGTNLAGKQVIRINMTTDSTRDTCELTWRGNTYNMTESGIYCSYTITTTMQAFDQWHLYSVTVNDTFGNTNTSDTRYVWFSPADTSSGSGDSSDGGNDDDSYCGDGMCDLDETIDTCRIDCERFTVSPKMITKPLTVTMHQTQINLESFYNQTIEIRTECLDDESCTWAMFMTPTTTSPIIDINVNEEEPVSFFIRVIVPEWFAKTEHSFNIILDDGTQVASIPYVLKMEHDEDWVDMFVLMFDDFLNRIYFEFPNQSIPPITGYSISISAFLLVSLFIITYAFFTIRKARKR